MLTKFICCIIIQNSRIFIFQQTKNLHKENIALSFPANYNIELVSTNALYYENGTYHIEVLIHIPTNVVAESTLFSVIKNSVAVKFNKRIDLLLLNLNGNEIVVKGVVLLPHTNYFIANGADIPSGYYILNATISEK